MAEILPELVSPDWQDRSKLIGYGVFSLVFRPPFLVPNSDLFQNSAKKIQDHPFGFVGLITTHKRYQREISTTTELLKELSSTYVQFPNLTVLPTDASPDANFLSLGDVQVQQLMEKFHAVRKKVEYEGSWKDKNLIQMIYPYAGKPLATFCKNPMGSPDWPTFFQSMGEIARLLMALHDHGYVHGDLSPNNILYDEKNAKFTIVDWNMLCKAEDFLRRKKGRMRVGCWSPEHFSLATVHLKDLESNRHWLIYANEVQKYIERLLDFSFSSRSSKASSAIREYFKPYMSQSGDSIFQTMYQELKLVARVRPSAIGKYHDVRYFIDTIAKTVSCIFPNQTEAQRNRYNLFLALCLMQNIPARSVYLDDPGHLLKRLSIILETCKNSEQKVAPLRNKIGDPLEAEQTLLKLLQ